MSLLLVIVHALGGLPEHTWQRNTQVHHQIASKHQPASMLTQRRERYDE